jgi:hypothetical protein
MFISHVGNVYPSGFLPIHAGNIRETPLADIYRNAPIFKSLRDTSKLEGKCGACEYKEIRSPRNPAASSSPGTGTRNWNKRPRHFALPWNKRHWSRCNRNKSLNDKDTPRA